MDYQLRRKDILLVEDNALDRILFQVCLRTQGARTHIVNRSNSAMVLLTQLQRIDLIVLDIILYKDITGFELFTQIRELLNYKDVPIVAVSGTDRAIAIPKAKELGFSGFVSKPIDMELFPSQLAEVLNGKEIW